MDETRRIRDPDETRRVECFDATRWVVFDAEGDGLSPTKFWCVSYHDYTGETGTLTDYQEMRDLFGRYDVYVGHNIKRWDLGWLERIVGIVKPDRIVDTLGLSWYLQPLRPKHGLESYGEEFGEPKPVVVDWHNQTLETYKNRCEKDVKINVRLWKEQFTSLFKIYEDYTAAWRFLRYLDFKMESARLAEESGWRLDVKYCRESLEELTTLRDDKLIALTRAMPRVAVKSTYEPPKRRSNADGQPSVLERRWQDRLESVGLPADHDGSVEIITGHDEPNPGSHQQVKDWLYSLGWKPQTIKYTRDKKTGGMKETPQINKEAQKGGGICDSIKKLYEKEPNLELLEGLGVLSHRISILNGFLRDVDDDDLLHARVAGLTNTLRFKHAELVNMPKPEKEYGEYIRRCLVAPDDDHELCGSDMSGLEDRIKQHFLQPHDPDYVASLQSSDYDPHLDIAVLAGGMTQGDADAYKLGDHSKKALRGVFKNGNYACQYGAGVSRIAITCGISEEEAKRLHKAYWERNWAIKEVAKEQETKTVDGQMWLFNPISRFWYSLRYEKDIFSTLVQGSASYCFDLWVRKVVEVRPQLTGQFHDEIVLTVKKGFREEIKAFLKDAIAKTNALLNLNRSLDVDVQFGEHYGVIH